MSSRAMVRLRPGKAMVWLIVAAGLLLVAAANVHLIYVAMSSQPDCVMHVRPGEGTPVSGAFSAARSACAPLTPRRTMREDGGQS